MSPYIKSCKMQHNSKGFSLRILPRGFLVLKRHITPINASQREVLSTCIKPLEQHHCFENVNGEG